MTERDDNPCDGEALAAGVLDQQDRDERDELAQRRHEALTELRARVAVLEREKRAASACVSCIHPRSMLAALSRDSVGAASLFWCSECGAIAGANGQPRLRPLALGEGPPPLAFTTPERAP